MSKFYSCIEKKKGFALEKLFLSGSGNAILSLYLSETEFKAVVLEQEEALGVSYEYHKIYLDNLQAEPWYMSDELLEEQLDLVKAELNKEEYDLDNLSVILTLENAVCVELIDLPLLEPKELEEALSWELPQRIAWEQGTYEYRYTSKLKPKELNGLESLADIQELYIYCLPKRYLEKLQSTITKLSLITSGIFVYEALDIDKESFEEEIKSIDFYASFFSEAKLQELRSLYYCPIVSALTYAEKKPMINFLSKLEQRRSLLLQCSGFCKLIAFAICGLSIFAFALSVGWEKYEHQKQEQLKSQYFSLAPWQERRERLISLEGNFSKLRQNAAYIDKQKIKWSKEFKTISRSLPQGCWLTELKQKEPEDKKSEGKLIVLTGRAETSELIMNFLEQLKHSGSFVKVEILNSGQEQHLYSFGIALELNTSSAKKNWSEE